MQREAEQKDRLLEEREYWMQVAGNEILQLRQGNEQLKALITDGCKRYRQSDFGGGNVC